jgi:hypothetical protein
MVETEKLSGIEEKPWQERKHDTQKRNSRIRQKHHVIKKKTLAIR